MGIPLAIVTLVGAWLAACLMHVDGHAAARSNPVRLFVATIVVYWSPLSVVFKVGNAGIG